MNNRCPQIEPKRDDKPTGEAVLAASDVSAKERELSELVDGCYVIIELYKPQSPSQEVWRKNWLEKAKRLVPGCDSLWY